MAKVGFLAYAFKVICKLLDGKLFKFSDYRAEFLKTLRDRTICIIINKSFKFLNLRHSI